MTARRTAPPPVPIHTSGPHRPPARLPLAVRAARAMVPPPRAPQNGLRLEAPPEPTAAPPHRHPLPPPRSQSDKRHGAPGRPSGHMTVGPRRWQGPASQPRSGRRHSRGLALPHRPTRSSSRRLGTRLSGRTPSWTSYSMPSSQASPSTASTSSTAAAAARPPWLGRTWIRVRYDSVDMEEIMQYDVALTCPRPSGLPIQS
mmetsp:Transcript_24201/g.78106  ORF Transcript_24201/g.78106 Transcript_24201/m.78106 type:complete len:201 (+) Transcript_24201:595-1197(+)